MDGKAPAGYPGYGGYSAPVPAREQKSTLIAGACSTLLPGLGQVYNGETAKGFALFIVTCVGLVILLIPGLIIWLYAMYDAHKTAGKMNTGEIPFREMRMLHVVLFVVFAIAVVAIGVIIMYMMVNQPLMSQFGSLDMGNAGNLGNTNDINQLINNAGVF
jgi:TM2 domain-containing membrane protein YozV